MKNLFLFLPDLLVCNKLFKKNNNKKFVVDSNDVFKEMYLIGRVCSKHYIKII